MMADLQVTQEVIVLLNSFHNVDLFQRGYYQIRCRVEEPPKLVSAVECEMKEETASAKLIPCLFKAMVDKYANTGVSKTIEVYYKHEEVRLKDVFIFKVHMLLDSSKIESQVPAKLNLILDLYFGESSRSPATPKSLEHASTQVVTLHLTYGEPYHAYRPIIFDYFHLGAVTVTVHSSITAVRQPWSASLKALHPIWSGKSGNVRQYTYSTLFGKNSSHVQPSHKLEYRHKESASFIHKKLCLVLLSLYENLLTNYHSVLLLLPDYVQMRLSKVDVEAKLEVLNSELNSLATAEEVYLRMGDDLYLLSTELNMLWMQFAEQFIYEDVLLKQLIEDHHLLRTEHMKEAVFTQEHPWEALCSSLEISTSQQARMFGDIKNSLYYQLIPPINMECSQLDGDCSTMPIIFEDRYIPGRSEDKNGDVLKVEESIVGDGFVDMDISIQDSSGKLTKLSISESDTAESAKNNINGSAKCPRANGDDGKNISKILNKKTDASWELNKDKIKSLEETDLTGPDYCLGATDIDQIECTVDGDTELNTEKEDGLLSDSSSELGTKFDNCNIKDAESGACDSTDHTHEGNSVFYKTEEENSLNDEVSLAEEAVESSFNSSENEKLVSKNSVSKNDAIDWASPANHQAKPKLWSCFPSKGDSLNRSPYKLSVRSQPYLPVPRKLSTRIGFVIGEWEHQVLRFQRAKENLEINSDIPGHHYSLTEDGIDVKPYFTEQTRPSTDNVHLVVCVHGLDGNSGDLRLVRCFLELATPRVNFDFLMSETNQEDTFCDIDEMTQRLVNEILDYIEEQSLDVVKLSFVGHSLGNIIIRNAVAHSSLYLFRNKLHTFLSLSGPHLGMQFHTSNLVSTGMWLMQKWKKCGSLVQLALNDSTDPRDSFMYRLSLTNGFQYFKNVLLVSSVQDHYVPFHSARVEMSKTVVKDNSDVGRVYKEMLDNIMNPLMAQEEVNIVKYSVHHPMPSSPNTFIGRAAHIAMLDSELFLEKFILCVAHKYFV